MDNMDNNMIPLEEIMHCAKGDISSTARGDFIVTPVEDIIDREVLPMLEDAKRDLASGKSYDISDYDKGLNEARKRWNETAKKRA